MPTGVHNDGGVVIGSQVLTIPTTAGVPYIANNIRYRKPTRVIESHDENGVPKREALVDTAITGTAQLQLSGSTIAAPALGDPFTVVPVGGGTALNFKVSEVGEAYEAQGETFVDISFRKKLN